MYKELSDQELINLAMDDNRRCDALVDELVERFQKIIKEHKTLYDYIDQLNKAWINSIPTV